MSRRIPEPIVAAAFFGLLAVALVVAVVLAACDHRHGGECARWQPTVVGKAIVPVCVSYRSAAHT